MCFEVQVTSSLHLKSRASFNLYIDDLWRMFIISTDLSTKFP